MLQTEEAHRHYRFQSFGACGGRRAKQRSPLCSWESHRFIAWANRSDASDVFVRIPIFGMSHGLINVVV